MTPTRVNRIFVIVFTAAITLLCGVARSTDLNLPTQPLVSAATVPPNVMVVVDDSGSMDWELLFGTNSGLLYWSDNNNSFVDNATTGTLKLDSNTGSYRYAYLFPNGPDGEGTGNRTYTGRQEVPPFPQFGFARSADYNGMYYNPAVTYKPWPGYTNIDATSALSDPAIGGSARHDLTNDNFNSDQDWRFFLQQGMTFPRGLSYYWPPSQSWFPGPTRDIFLGQTYDLGIQYYPATYYKPVSSGTYDIRGTGGNCATPTPSHYRLFERAPSGLTGTNAPDALAPDGVCLERVEITGGSTYSGGPDRDDCGQKPDCTYAEEMQNFANWFSYYRKRHMTLRAGMGLALDNEQDMRAGVFTINDAADNSPTINMLDLSDDADHVTFLASLFSITGRARGTPNREGLNHAGQQFMRTGSNAPIVAECQKNFALLFTDGFSYDNDIGGIGNEDGNAGAPYADSQNDTLGDIAYKYYTDNLRPDLTKGQVGVDETCDDKPPSPPPLATTDCNQDLHMNTYTVGLNAKGSLFGVTHSNVQDAHDNAPTWPDANSGRGNEGPEQVDDLYHAAVNGRGEIYNAESPQQLAKVLKEALGTITVTGTSSTGVSVDAGSVNTGLNVFQARFSSEDWTGELLSWPINNAEDTVCSDKDPGEVCDTPNWNAGCVLTGGSCEEPAGSGSMNKGNPRKLFTFDPTANNGDGKGIPFSWSELSTAQQASLDLDSSGQTDTKGEDRLLYLRGETGDGSFRLRASLLGDIAHSSPLHVAPPRRFYPQDGEWKDLKYPSASMPENSDDYIDFIKNKDNRESVVYAGANNGFLHAFDAKNGVELFGFMPSQALDKARHLTYADYSHRFYVDGPLKENDVYYGGSWETVLVGTLGLGGQGVFALEITDPAAVNESTSDADGLVLWEFTDRDDADLGYVLGKPSVVRMHNGRWAAIFSSGYNSSEDDGAQSPDDDGDQVPDGNGVIFVVDIKTGELLAKLDTGEGAGQDPTGRDRPNGLATPFAIDIDGDVITDYIYAADLFGNVWRFDVTGKTSGKWESPTSRTKLFQARRNGVAQPITTEVQVGRHPLGEKYGAMVYFGTGKYLENGDQIAASNAPVQTFYAVWDTEVAGRNPPSLPLDRDDLVEQTIDTTEDSYGRTFRKVSDKTVNYTAGSPDYGWYMDLIDSGGQALGEMVIADPTLRIDVILFNTFIPNSGECDTDSSGFLMILDGANGGPLEFSPFDKDLNGTFDSKDLLSSGGVAGGVSVDQTDTTLATNKSGTDKGFGTDTKGKLTEIDLKVLKFTEGRQSWRQLR